MSKQEAMSVFDYVKNAYTVLGRDIMGSDFQVGRMFTDKYDGLKISYRHYLQCLWEQPNQMVKVQAVLGDAMKKYHFHGDGGAQEVIYALANDYKCVETQGNSGSRTMSITMKGSAGRYVECKLKEEVRSQFNRLMPFVPEEETVTGYKEKRYIPTPLPLGLIAGTGMSMGVGMRNNLPAFTAKSLYQAYLKEDPSLLRLNYGYSLGTCWDEKSRFTHETNKITGKDLSDEKPTKENIEALRTLWETGETSLNVGIPMYKCTIDGTDGFMLVCDPALFTPKKSKKIEEWEAAGLIEVFDYSDEIGKMFFSLTPRTKKISLEDLRKEIYENCDIIKNLKYQVNIATGDITGKVGIGNWIDFTHHNYEKLYKEFIKSELKRLDKEEIVWYNFRAVVDLLIDKKAKHSDKEIVDLVNAKLDKGSKADKAHKISIEHVEFIGAKAYNTMRNSDPEDKLKKIEEERQKYKNMDIEKEIKAFVDCWQNL